MCAVSRLADCDRPQTVPNATSRTVLAMFRTHGCMLGAAVATVGSPYASLWGLQQPRAKCLDGALNPLPWGAGGQAAAQVPAEGPPDTDDNASRQMNSQATQAALVIADLKVRNAENTSED